MSELPAGDELTAGWSADGLDVVVLQLHSLRCQLVQCRCVDVSVVVADVVEALIICHDEDNVRTRMVRLFDLVRTRPVLGQIAQTQQTHHGERRQSRCCHGNAFKRLHVRKKIMNDRLNCRYERKVCVRRQSDVCARRKGSGCGSKTRELPRALFFSARAQNSCTRLQWPTMSSEINTFTVDYVCYSCRQMLHTRWYRRPMKCTMHF